jgi:hypothetical protein
MKVVTVIDGSFTGHLNMLPFTVVINKAPFYAAVLQATRVAIISFQ